MVHFNKDVKVGNRTLHINGEKFENINEFFSTNKSRTKVRNDFNPDDIGGYDFTGVHSYIEAKDLIFNGYQEALDEFVKTLNVQGNNKKKLEFFTDVAGFQPIVPRAIMGLPNALINSKITHVKTPVIDIYYDPRFCGDTPKERFIEVGKKLLSVILGLERNKYKINLYYCNFKCDDDDDLDVCILKLKNSNQPLNINRITFPIAHPAMLRVFSFEWTSKVPGGHYRSGYGSGLVNNFNKEKRDIIIKSLLGNNARFISAEVIENMEIYDIFNLLKG